MPMQRPDVNGIFVSSHSLGDVACWQSWNVRGVQFILCQFALVSSWHSSFLFVQIECHTLYKFVEMCGMWAIGARQLSDVCRVSNKNRNKNNLRKLAYIYSAGTRRIHARVKSWSSRCSNFSQYPAPISASLFTLTCCCGNNLFLFLL